MSRHLKIAAAQLGPIHRADTREAVVTRLIALMREAHSQGDLIDRVLTSFSDSLDAALEDRAHGALDAHPHGGMSAPGAG